MLTFNQIERLKKDLFYQSRIKAFFNNDNCSKCDSTKINCKLFKYKFSGGHGLGIAYLCPNCQKEFGQGFTLLDINDYKLEELNEQEIFVLQIIC